MLWSTHRVITGSLVFAVTGNIVAAITAIEGSVFPDRIEMVCPFIHHRTLGHWWVLYTIPLILLFLFSEIHLIKGAFDYIKIFQHMDFYLAGIQIFSNLLIWYFIGSLCHIIEDALTGYIPILNPCQKKGFTVRAFYTGSEKEISFMMLWVMIMSILVFIKITVFGMPVFR